MSQIAIKNTDTESDTLCNMVLASFDGTPEVSPQDLKFGNIPQYKVLAAIAQLKTRGLVRTRMDMRGLTLVDLRQ